MSFEDAALTGIAQGGPMTVLLYVVWREMKEQTRKLDAMIEAIAYWGKRSIG